MYGSLSTAFFLMLRPTVPRFCLPPFRGELCRRFLCERIQLFSSRFPGSGFPCFWIPCLISLDHFLQLGIRDRFLSVLPDDLAVDTVRPFRLGHSRVAIRRDLGPQAFPVLIFMDRLGRQHEAGPGRVVRRVGVRDQDPLVGFAVLAGEVFRKPLSELDRQFLKFFSFIQAWCIPPLFIVFFIQPVVRIIFGNRLFLHFRFLRQFIDIQIIVVIQISCVRILSGG